MKNQVMKVVANSTRLEAEKELTNLSLKPNNISKLMKCMKKDGKDIGGRCIRGKNRKLSFSEEDRKRLRKITWMKS